MNDWNFGDKFPSIEIDTEYWRTLSAQERMKYLMRLVFQEKDFGNRINMINYIMGTTVKVGRAFIKNKEIIGYLDIMEQSTNLIAVSAAVGNVFKAKQKYKNTKNNEIAKLMGFPNGNYIDEMNMDVTHAMIECFIEMSDYHREKYNIVIEHVVDDSSKKEDSVESPISKTFKLAGSLDKEIKWGMTVKTMVGMSEGEDTTSSTNCRLFHSVTGMKLHPDELRDKITQIMLELYIEKVDTKKNFIIINGTKLEIQNRVPITEEITNLPIPKIVTAITRVLNEGTRRGMVFVGEPGVGKTISLHKIINEFSDRLVFWVSPDSINSVHGIRSTFKIFKMFKNSIVIFDDLDSAPFTSKDEITNEFLKHLDGKNNRDLTGFYIATVNDPSKLHMTVINRPERFDDVMLVENPKSIDEVSSIFFNKARERGYYPTAEFKKAFSPKGKVMFTKNSKEFVDIADTVIANHFTQVMVAGLVSDCHTFTTDGNITLDLLKDAVESRLRSIDTANMVSKKGRLKIDMDEISEEAKANLNRKR